MPYFKTSYVEVYPNRHVRTDTAEVISKHLMLKFIAFRISSVADSYTFQNILCWSLSQMVVSDLFHRANFKTSYVEVYLISVLVSISPYLDFKTSYVEVYLLYQFPCSFHNFISKHLMLKFIQRDMGQSSNWRRFQNILCWSLSEYDERFILRTWISKHLMLKFIPHFLVTFISFYLFSPSFFLISIIFTKHQPIFFFLSNISQIPRLYNTFSTFFFFSPGKYFYNSQSGMGCSSDVFTTENAWS